MSEFQLIDRYCRNLGADHPETRIPVGDDAAVINVPAGMELAISVDSMVEGIHFLPDTEPAKLAHKLMAVNLSDMAAMGAIPKWATVTLTMPTQEESWLSGFSSGLDQIAQRYGVQLIGGDTTRGSLNLSLNIIGLLPKGKAISRSGAKVGDEIFVSGTLGDAALGLSCLTGDAVISQTDSDAMIERLVTPVPQVELGQKLLDLANACIDISDGLVADLGHIADQSDISCAIEIDQIPLSEAFSRYLDDGGDMNLALTGGDDYQLAFTIDNSHRPQIESLASELGVRLSCIGTVCERVTSTVTLTKSGRPYDLPTASGFQHF